MRVGCLLAWASHAWYDILMTMTRTPLTLAEINAPINAWFGIGKDNLPYAQIIKMEDSELNEMQKSIKYHRCIECGKGSIKGINEMRASAKNGHAVWVHLPCRNA